MKNRTDFKKEDGSHFDKNMQPIMRALSEYDLPVTAMCFGHLDEHQSRLRADSFPMVEIYIPKPQHWPGLDQDWKDWHERVVTSGEVVMRLLAGFYRVSMPDFDSRLTVTVTHYQTRAIYVESIGARIAHLLPLSNQQAALNRYRAEMNRFAEFLQTGAAAVVP